MIKYLRINIQKIGWIVFCLILIKVIFVFYLGMYRYALSDESSSLSLENTLHVAKGHREINMIVLGDSTSAEGFRTNYFNSHAKGLKAADMGVPGTWFYSHDKLQETIKMVNPRIDTVLLFLGPDEFMNDGDNRLPSDIEYHKTTISSADFARIIRYSDSFPDVYNNAARIVLAPVLYKRDLTDFLMNLKKRIHLIPRNLFWLNRPISSSDPFWEDDRAYTMCNIGPLNKVEERYKKAIQENNATDSAHFLLVQGAYSGRKQPKAIYPYAEKNLNNLVSRLSNNFKHVYIVNAPENPYLGIYPEKYLQQISELSKKISSRYKNVVYIPRNTTVENNCANFMDVVHLNVKGAEKFTDYLAKSINKSQ